MSRTVQTLKLLAAERIAKSSGIEAVPPGADGFVSHVDPSPREKKKLEEEQPERKTAS